MLARKIAFLTVLLLAIARSAAFASVLYIYDFPGSPGSGLAASQTNLQPANATFSDFTRSTVTASSTADVFDSDNWSTNASLDPNTYVGFSITAAPGYHLNLSQITFDAGRTANGPVNAEAALFLNGSTTPYATFLFAPTQSDVPFPSYTFSFTPLTEADNATSAVVQFFGWNAGGVGSRFGFDNVATSGTISNLPESHAFWPIVLLLGCIVIERLRRKQIPAGPAERSGISL